MPIWPWACHLRSNQGQIWQKYANLLISPLLLVLHDNIVCTLDRKSCMRINLVYSILTLNTFFKVKRHFIPFWRKLKNQIFGHISLTTCLRYIAYRKSGSLAWGFIWCSPIWPWKHSSRSDIVSYNFEENWKIKYLLENCFRTEALYVA